MRGETDRAVQCRRFICVSRYSQSCPSTSAPVRPPRSTSCRATRVRDVRRHVQQVLAGPPGAHRGGESVPLAQECTGQDDRQRELKEASSEDADEAAEDAEDHVAGFVKDEIRQVQE